jgi:hypothetical protein
MRNIPGSIGLLHALGPYLRSEVLGVGSLASFLLICLSDINILNFVI